MADITEKNAQSDKKQVKGQKASLKISGMHCAVCAANLESALKGADGIESASVDFASGTAELAYLPEKINISDIEKIIRDAGYSLLKDQIKIKIGGMHCAVCAGKISEALLKTDGVLSADVSLTDNSAYISYTPGYADRSDFLAAVAGAGFEFLGAEDEAADEDFAGFFSKEQNDRKLRIIIGFLVSAVLIVIMFFWKFSIFPASYLMFAITTPAFLYLGYPVFHAAFSSLKNRMLSMDVMYAMGIGVSYFASVLGTFGLFLTEDFMFYETSVMLAAFLTLGRYLEAKAKGKTNDAVKKLIELSPKTAFVRRGDEFTEVFAEELVSGDEIMVKPGGRIPVDGVISSGEGYIDESMITGEPVPKRKKAGDSVIGGTLNTSGAVIFRSTKVGRDTVLSQIIKLVEETQRQKPPVQRIADTAVAYFIPAILSIAVISSLSWLFLFKSSLLFAVTVFVSIIVVACPCALGLATPTAVTVGIGRGAELGILIKNGEALEICGKLKCVVFDKTGTLTAGKPAVVSVKSFGTDEKELLSLAAGAEYNSEHPIAKAILKKAEDEKIKPAKVSDFKSYAGGGVAAEYNGKKLFIGNRDFIEKSGFEISAEALSELKESMGIGRTAVIAALENSVIGVISVSDSLKPDAGRAVRELKSQGLSVAMITGDSEDAARHISKQAGIDEFYAGVLPAGKSLKVRSIREIYGPVSFVGDGINDAPALAEADAGIAVGSGTEIALESADIVLMRESLIGVPAAIQLSKKVMGRIKLNLFWAFAYNTALIPVAAGLLYPFFGIVFRPEYAGLAMALSSATVVSLSLLLKNYTPPALREKTKAAD